jgi:hypothetical protein
LATFEIDLHKFTSGWLLLAALLLAAFVLRIHRLDAVPLRGDEAYSVVHWTATPFSERWGKLVRDEPAPVGAFTMYWIWNGLVGKSAFATRYLSLLGNVAGWPSSSRWGKVCWATGGWRF